MAPTVFYMNSAVQDVYDILREELPPKWTLLTLRVDSEQERQKHLRNADFLLVAHNDVTRDHLECAPGLKMIQHQGVGYERIDLGACRELGVPLALCPEGTSIGVAEHTFLLILAVYKQLVEAANALTEEGKWLQWELRKTSFELHGKLLGIVGFGRIGIEVAKRALVFGAQVAFFDPVLREVPPEFPPGSVTRVGALAELMKVSDIVSLHCPVTEQTKGLINRERLGRMKPGAILINAARGELVVEEDLAWALTSGRIAGAGLDVLRQEPPSASHPLIGMKNVLITPHIAAGSVDALRKKARFCFENMQRALDGEHPKNVVPESLPA